MIISVTAPRKRMGQTITAINLSLMFSKLLGDTSLLVDMNKYCRDVEYYLSNTFITKGLDDFYSLYRANLLTQDSFKVCVKKVWEHLDIMGANECFDLGEQDAGLLLKYLEKIYKIGVIDTAGDCNPVTEAINRKSDIVVSVIVQSKNVVDHMRKRLNGFPAERVVVVVNRHRKEIKYSLKNIQQDLQDAGLHSRIFPLDFDLELVNECNDHSLLNHILNNFSENRVYVNQLEAVARHILTAGGLEWSGQAEEKRKRKGFFKALPLLNTHFMKL